MGRVSLLSAILPSQGQAAQWPHPASTPNTPPPTLPGWPKSCSTAGACSKRRIVKKRDLDDYLTIPSLFSSSCSDSHFVQPHSCSPSRSDTHISTLAHNTHTYTLCSHKIWGFLLSTWHFSGDCGVNEAVFQLSLIWYNFLCPFEHTRHTSKLSIKVNSYRWKGWRGL